MEILNYYHRKGVSGVKKLGWEILFSSFLIVSLLLVQAGSASANAVWKIDFSSDIRPEGVKTSTNYCWDGSNYLTMYTKDSSLSIHFTLAKDDYKGYSLKVTDRGTILNMESVPEHGGGVFSPYKISVNGVPVAEHVDIKWTADKTTGYDIGKYLKEGENVIMLSLLIDARTKYEVKSLTLEK
ncbi:MAG: hypothetical protein RDV48_01385 [Candidatus Eremiobacteraeota bacterium]|nr:hypothetical protein [Candidatus Eremiobacteraeota bacterium]